MDVLLAGNTGYWTKEALMLAFPEDNVVICDSEHEDARDGRIKWFKQPIISEKFERLFMTYGFERVVYFSRYLTNKQMDKGELDELRRVLYMSHRTPIKQFVYVASDEILLDADTSVSILYKSAEEICRYYAANHSIEFKIINIPHLISGTYKEDFWCRVFDKLEKREKVVFDAARDEVADYLAVEDLAVFLERLFDKWPIEDAEPGVASIYLKSGAKITYGQIKDILLCHYLKADISFKRSKITTHKIYGPDIARNEYGWFAKRDAAADMESYLEAYRNLYYKKPSFTEWLASKIKLNSKFMMVVELILGAGFVELYNNYASGSVQFRMIDVRLIFVVLMSTVYGTTVGGVAAVMSIASLVWAYYRQGSNGLLIFYDPGNWIPFILLLVTAAACGYVKQRKDEELAFMRDENKTIGAENQFITQLYKEAMEYKDHYKQDLIGSRDGFGRIFEVVQRLSTTVPEEIFAESIPVMEDVLNNKTIAIYTINDPSARFARLNVSSESISSSLKKSINLEDYQEVLKVLDANDIWFNSEIEEGFPTYVAGIKADGAVSVLIMIYHVEYLQVNTYYTNLIRILSGLMENFILKAWEYQRAVAEKTYIEGTNITRTDYFRQQLEIQKDMAENRLTSFRLFRILREDRSLSEIDEMFRSKTRNNDIIGLGDDGNIYILASQVDENSQNIVLNRFLGMGLNCDIVENMG